MNKVKNIFVEFVNEACVIFQSGGGGGRKTPNSGLFSSILSLFKRQP